MENISLDQRIVNATSVSSAENEGNSGEYASEKEENLTITAAISNPAPMSASRLSTANSGVPKNTILSCFISIMCCSLLQLGPQAVAGRHRSYYVDFFS